MNGSSGPGSTSVGPCRRMLVKDNRGLYPAELKRLRYFVFGRPPARDRYPRSSTFLFPRVEQLHHCIVLSLSPFATFSISLFHNNGKSCVPLRARPRIGARDDPTGERTKDPGQQPRPNARANGGDLANTRLPPPPPPPPVLELQILTELSFVLLLQASPRSDSPANAPAASSGASTARPSSPTPPGGARTAIRRRAAADQKEKIANARPSSTRAAGAGGSTSTMLSTSLAPCQLLRAQSS